MKSLGEVNYITVQYNPWAKTFLATSPVLVLTAIIYASPTLFAVIDWLAAGNNDRPAIVWTAAICVTLGMLTLKLQSYLNTRLRRSAIKKELGDYPYRYSDIRFQGENEFTAGDPKISGYFRASISLHDTNVGTNKSIETFKVVR